MRACNYRDMVTVVVAVGVAIVPPGMGAEQPPVPQGRPCVAAFTSATAIESGFLVVQGLALYLAQVIDGPRTNSTKARKISCFAPK
jgi:hypothetical protein